MLRHHIVSVLAHPLRKDDVFVFSGHTCGPFSCFFIQTVLFSRATLLLQFPDLKRSWNRALTNTQHRPYFCTWNLDSFSEPTCTLKSQHDLEQHQSPKMKTLHSYALLKYYVCKYWQTKWLGDIRSWRMILRDAILQNNSCSAQTEYYNNSLMKWFQHDRRKNTNH